MAKIVGHALASISADLTAVDDAQRNELGTRVKDKNGNEYIYLGGVASVAVGDWVTYNPSTGAVVRTVSNTAVNGPLAVAMAATVALKFGWYQIFGIATCNIATDAAADGKSLSNGAGANGRLITGTTTTKNVFNCVCVGAAASNLGSAFITYPYMFGSATI